MSQRELQLGGNETERAMAIFGIEMLHEAAGRGALIRLLRFLFRGNGNTDDNQSDKLANLIAISCVETILIPNWRRVRSRHGQPNGEDSNSNA